MNRADMESEKVQRSRNKTRRRKSASSLKGVGLNEGSRSLSEGASIASRRRDVSKERPTGSSVVSLEVRCACQYYQCDSLLPEKGSLVGTRPPSRSNATYYRDHEYEPVNPPPENVEIIPTVKISDNPTVCIINTDQILNNPQTYNFIEEEVYKQDPAFQLKFQKDSKMVHHPGTDAKSKEGPSKFQLAIKQRADNFKTKLHNIKKPHITLPDRPKFHKPNFHKFSLPKIPDTAKINFPSFSLPRRHGAKRPLKERHLSTESNDGDSKKPIFDFSTYPRIFKKKPKDQEPAEQEIPSFATVRRTKKPEKPKTDDSRWSAGSGGSVRVPLHSEDSVEAEYREETEHDKERYVRGDSIEENEPSHIRYDQDIDSDDEYDRENRDLNKERDFLTRTRTYPEHESYPEDYGKYPEDHGKYPVGHGKYQRDHGIYPEDQEEYIQEGQEYIENIINRQPRITDLDSPEDMPERAYQFGNNNGREHYSSGSSQGGHRQGVLEEINPDEFFLRQKGISQDNIEVGKYLSSEIREAFRTPVNALSQMQGKDHDYEMRGSNQSLPEIPAKRKSIKKPKRKKTPHTSQEKIPYDGESGEDELGAIPPSRPKRHSRRTKKQKNADDLIPYQETITVDTVADPRLVLHRESLGILGDDERDEEVPQWRMEGKDEPGFRISDPYRNFEYADEDDVFEEVPAAPPRKQKSLKSLNMSENDSIMGDFSSNKAIFSSEKDILEPEIEAIRTESKIIIPIQPNVPKRPSRTISRTNSQSRGTSQMDDESVLSLNAESIVSENQIPCVEEPCVKDLRDSMGYAIIDKSKVRDPPLPPPRIPTRRKRSFRNGNDFFTVPRSSHTADSPVRPLRNYSTLGQSRKSQRSYSNTYENKENIDIDIGQYIEMDDDPARNLQSGAVINKMKDRPLPAPPRPPRKSRPLHDITSQENIHKFGSTTEMIKPEETEMSTQTEPLPDDFICEEVVQEPTDTIIIPSRDLEQKHSSVVSNRTEELISKEALKEPKDLMVVPPRSSNGRKAPLPLSDNQLCEGIDDSPVGRISKATDEFISREVMEKSTPRSQEVKPTIERRLITPTVYTYEETVTHGSLLVKPLDGAKVLPDSDISNVRTIPVHVDSDAEETSSIPEEFNTLRDPSKSARSLEVEKPTAHSTKANEFDVLKAQKLQVVDLDVDKLTVNKLLAQKIIVSEIDSSNIQTNEISSKTGALTVGEISLPPGVIDQIIEKIKSSQVKGLGHQGTEDGCGLQKKTPMNDCPNLCSPQFEADAEIKRNGNSSVSGIHEVSNEPTQLSMQTNPSNMPENLPENVEEIIIDQKCLPETEESLKHQSQGGAPKASPEASDSSFQDKPIEAPNQQYFEESASKPPSDFNTPDLSIGATVQQSLEDQNVEESPPKPPPRAYDFNTVVSVQTPEEQSLEDSDVLETAPKPPPRSSDSPEKIKTDGPAPSRPPRQSGRNRGGSVSTQEESLQEPEVDDEPPPRPPHPQLEYILSQPPASFYALRAQKYVDTLGESAPTVPRRRRQTKSKQLSRSSSEESVPTLIPRRLHRRPSDLSNVSIATLSGQLVRVCGSEVNNSLKRLITYILNNVLRNEDGKQDLNVMIIIVLVLIAGLILLGYGDEKTVVHLHHWEYFNPPRNM
ncbi:hypothetical protein JTB14_016262 [Gonioctena quinquepunctata]|nr:hypothetical protein JTB14_016262 [Gonioctena quinquepunctata]